MQPLHIQFRPITDLIPYARKLRKHDHSVQRMMALLKEYGFRIPILILSTGEIIDGHLRIKAATLLGFKEIPVIVCDDWTETQVKAFRLAVNRSASWADWDLNLVAIELGELKALNFDLTLTAFDSLEIDRLLFPKKDSPEQDQPEGSGGEAVTRLGDVWNCGGHRILCGDSTSAEQVSSFFGSAKPVLLVTDPPFGVNYDPEWRGRADLGQPRQTGKVANDDRCDWTAAYELFPGDVAYVWHAGVHAAEVARGIEAAGFVIRAQIVWSKQHFALSRGDYHWQHEPCWYAVRKGKSSQWSGDRTQSTLWEVPNLNPFGGSDDEATGHGTQKPVEVMRRPILNNSRRGDIVYDAFLGSGSALVAAALTDRICFGIDISPVYVDVAVKRWQKLTGKQAVLEGSDKTWDEIAVDRREVAVEV